MSSPLPRWRLSVGTIRIALVLAALGTLQTTASTHVWRGDSRWDRDGDRRDDPRRDRRHGGDDRDHHRPPVATGSITAISPTEARVGDLVTITGQGLATFNAQVAVGGVTAPVVSASGNRLVFRVPSGAPAGPTDVTATGPGGRGGSIPFRVFEGMLVPGDAAALMKDAAFELVPEVGVDADQIEDGIMLTRLEVRFAATATVGQVNAALLAVNGGVVGMSKGLTTISLAVPRAASVADLDVTVSQLSTLPGVQLANLAYALQPDFTAFNPITQENASQIQQLLPSRFPAAWNAAPILDLVDDQGRCRISPVPVLVADYFAYDPPPELQPFLPVFAHPARPATGFPSYFLEHGYVVSSVLAGFRVGANPFALTTGCVAVTPVQVGGFAPNLATDQIVRHLPADKAIVNYSLGFRDACVGTAETPGTPCLPPHDHLQPPFLRAQEALYWKQKTSARWPNVLVVAAAGNERDEESTIIYRGMGDARYGSPMNIAAQRDPSFQFVADPTLWEPDPAFVPRGFESLVPDDVSRQRLAESIADAGSAGSAIADNVIVVGSATHQTTDSLLSQHVTPEQLGESVFSDNGAEVLAVGEGALGHDNYIGTSVAAPLVSGLASYLWMISPELRAEPVATTKQIILANSRNRVIDAYATVLALDPATVPTPGNAPAREAILDVDGDNVFTDADIAIFMDRLFVDNGGIVSPAPAATADFSRFDLNGDGFTTAGARRERFDLNREGSTRFGATVYSTVSQTIQGQEIHFDETAVTDLEILCYYSYSPLFLGVSQLRDDLLAGHCGVSVQPSTATLTSGQQQQFTANGPNNPAFVWSTTAPDGSISPAGLFTAGPTPGIYKVRAASAADPTVFSEATVTVHGRGGIRLLQRSCSTSVQSGVTFPTTAVKGKDCDPSLPNSTMPAVSYTAPDVTVDGLVGGFHYLADYDERLSEAELATDSISSAAFTLHTQAASTKVPAGQTSNPDILRAITNSSYTFAVLEGEYRVTIHGRVSLTLPKVGNLVQAVVSAGTIPIPGLPRCDLTAPEVDLGFCTIKLAEQDLFLAHVAPGSAFGQGFSLTTTVNAGQQFAISASVTATGRATTVADDVSDGQVEVTTMTFERIR